MVAMQYAAASVVRRNPDLGGVLKWYDEVLGLMMSIEDVAPGTLDLFTSVFMERLSRHPGAGSAEKTMEALEVLSARAGMSRGRPGGTATTASSREDEADAFR